VVLNSVKRLDLEKLIEFLFGSGKADLELFHKIFIRCNRIEDEVEVIHLMPVEYLFFTNQSGTTCVPRKNCNN
jgi:hypothetical protein